jgi:5-hydroxyisourate hydrolase-like protein (transthyretin family)
MKTLSALLLLALPGVAAVTGTVVNRTTGQPLAGATVELNRLSGNGVEPIGQARTDAQGRFSIGGEAQGPQLLRVAFDGVTYFRTLSPGAPTADIALDVYASSKQPDAAKVSKHMLFFEPSASGHMAIQETFIYTNGGKTAWHDPGKGELRFYLPAAAGGKAQVEATAPGGMPIPASLLKTSSADVMAVDFAIKPGETRFDVTYSVPYTPGEPYQGKVVTQDENTYLIAPQGITLAGDGLSDLGTEPRTQAHIFGLPGTTYKIALTGAGAAAPESGAPAADEGESGPPIEAVPPRINGHAVAILGLALAILAVGFALLYRKSPALPPPSKEANERGRR